MPASCPPRKNSDAIIIIILVRETTEANNAVDSGEAGHGALTVTRRQITGLERSNIVVRYRLLKEAELKDAQKPADDG